MREQQPRTLVILQPSYIPWLGYFAQMEKSDLFIVYDDVQFDKGSWRNRNRIKTPQGTQWLTVPVLLKRQNHPANNEIQINNTVNWRCRHLNALRQNYVKAPFFQDYFSFFEKLFSLDYHHLIDLNIAVLDLLTKLIGLRREILLSSNLKIEGFSTLRLINICRYFSATKFYEGAAGQNYIDEAAFKQAGIELCYQNYKHPVYNQLYGDFIPYLSVVDLLFNCGSQSLSILSENKVITRMKSLM